VSIFAQSFFLTILHQDVTKSVYGDTMSVYSPKNTKNTLMDYSDLTQTEKNMIATASVVRLMDVDANGVVTKNEALQMRNAALAYMARNSSHLSDVFEKGIIKTATTNNAHQPDALHVQLYSPEVPTPKNPDGTPATLSPDHPHVSKVVALIHSATQHQTGFLEERIHQFTDNVVQQIERSGGKLSVPHYEENTKAVIEARLEERTKINQQFSSTTRTLVNALDISSVPATFDVPKAEQDKPDGYVSVAEVHVVKHQFERILDQAQDAQHTITPDSLSRTIDAHVMLPEKLRNALHAWANAVQPHDTPSQHVAFTKDYLSYASDNTAAMLTSAIESKEHGGKMKNENLSAALSIDSYYQLKHADDASLATPKTPKTSNSKQNGLRSL
jgi:hypothetical protein